MKGAHYIYIGPPTYSDACPINRVIFSTNPGISIWRQQIPTIIQQRIRSQFIINHLNHETGNPRDFPTRRQMPFHRHDNGIAREPHFNRVCCPGGQYWNFYTGTT